MVRHHLTRALVAAAGVLMLIGVGADASTASQDDRGGRIKPQATTASVAVESSSTHLDPTTLILASLAAVVFLRRRRH